MSEPTGRGGIDAPDFLVPSLPHKQRVQIGLSEHAVRLGSPYSFEVTGNLLHYEQFEYGLSNWRLLYSNAACKPVLDPMQFYKKPYSVKLRTDGTTGQYSTLVVEYPYPYLSTIGIEFAFYTRQSFAGLYLTLDLYTGTRDYRCGMYVNEVNDLLYYWDNGLGLVKLADLTELVYSTAGWNLFKMVMDFPNTEYARMLLNGVDYSMPGIACYSNPIVDSPRLKVQFQLRQVAGVGESLWLDNVVLTINEPI